MLWLDDVMHNPISLRVCVGVKQAKAAATKNVNIGPSKLNFWKQFLQLAKGTSAL